jgi:uncharacterized protein (DUF433 family)
MPGLTGLTDHELRYWDKTGFVTRHDREQDDRARLHRYYFFRDIVALRVVAILRPLIPATEIRKIGSLLAQRADVAWHCLLIAVVDRRAYLLDRSSNTWVGAEPPTGGDRLDIDLGIVEGDVRAAAERLKQRDPDDVGRVVQDPRILRRKPILAGTRIPTEAVWSFHVAGYNTDEIIEQYPSLTPEDIHAALEWEAQARQQRAG